MRQHVTWFYLNKGWFYRLDFVFIRSTTQNKREKLHLTQLLHAKTTQHTNIFPQLLIIAQLASTFIHQITYSLNKLQMLQCLKSIQQYLCNRNIRMIIKLEPLYKQ